MWHLRKGGARFRHLLAKQEDIPITALSETRKCTADIQTVGSHTFSYGNLYLKEETQENGSLCYGNSKSDMQFCFRLDLFKVASNL